MGKQRHLWTLQHAPQEVLLSKQAAAAAAGRAAARARWAVLRCSVRAAAVQRRAASRVAVAAAELRRLRALIVFASPAASPAFPRPAAAAAARSVRSEAAETLFSFGVNEGFAAPSPTAFPAASRQHQQPGGALAGTGLRQQAQAGAALPQPAAALLLEACGIAASVPEQVAGPRRSSSANSALSLSDEDDDEHSSAAAAAGKGEKEGAGLPSGSSTEQGDESLGGSPRLRNSAAVGMMASVEARSSRGRNGSGAGGGSRSAPVSPARGLPPRPASVLSFADAFAACSGAAAAAPPRQQEEQRLEAGGHDEEPPPPPPQSRASSSRLLPPPPRSLMSTSRLLDRLNKQQQQERPSSEAPAGAAPAAAPAAPKRGVSFRDLHLMVGGGGGSGAPSADDSSDATSRSASPLGYAASATAASPPRPALVRAGGRRIVSADAANGTGSWGAPAALPPVAVAPRLSSGEAADGSDNSMLPPETPSLRSPASFGSSRSLEDLVAASAQRAAGGNATAKGGGMESGVGGALPPRSPTRVAVSAAGSGSGGGSGFTGPRQVQRTRTLQEMMAFFEQCAEAEANEVRLSLSAAYTLSEALSAPLFCRHV